MNKFENIPRNTDKSSAIEKLRVNTERTLKLLMAVGILSFGGSKLATLFSYEKSTRKDGKGIEYLIKDAKKEKKYKIGSHPEDYIDYIEQSKREQLSELEKESIKIQLEYLKNEFSGNIIAFLAVGDISRKEKNTELQVNGFEKIGVPVDRLKELWTEPNYPSSVLENVSEISFVKKDKDLKHYGIKNEAVAGTGENAFEDQIIFYGGIGNQSEVEIDTVKENLDWHFSHELGHLNDWTDGNNFLPSERVHFLYEVTRAFHEDGSFRDLLGYIESIKNPVKEKENFYKVREWWATLCEYYFTFPEILQEDASEDFRLVERWMRINSSEYDPIKAKSQRDSLLKVATQVEIQESK